MPADFPDGVMPMIQATIIAQVPKPAEPETVYVWGGVVRLPTSSTDYVVIKSVTVTEGRTGKLCFVEVDSEDFTHTRFKLVIGTTTFFTDLQLHTSLSLNFGDLELAAAVAVTLSGKSSDGTAIVCYGDIIGKEVA